MSKTKNSNKLFPHLLIIVLEYILCICKIGQALIYPCFCSDNQLVIHQLNRTVFHLCTPTFRVTELLRIRPQLRDRKPPPHKCQIQALCRIEVWNILLHCSNNLPRCKLQIVRFRKYAKARSFRRSSSQPKDTWALG